MTEILSDEAENLKRAYLIQTSPHSGQTFELKDFVTLGRDPGNHLTLNDPTVSGRHARVENRDQSYFIRDQNSRNGVYLNGNRVLEARLKPNDRIRLGESEFLFTEAPNENQKLTSKNEFWNEQLKRLAAFAATEFPVMIIGPSGSGKELVAKELHDKSARSKGPFVTINCSALTENLIESELFGHLKGSFTGALNDRKGAFEIARGGTLFLDEIGDLPASLQPKLLRAIENHEIRPVGSDRNIQTNVRIVAATHKNLRQMVSAGDFREDLYFRLNVCRLTPPSLTDRMEDFEDLVYQFAKTMRVRLSIQAIQRLKSHTWPGNVRELRNVIARGAAFFQGQNISAEQIESLIEPDLSTQALSKPAETNLPIIKEIERDMIVQRLVANKGNQKKAALELGLPKSTLHDRIRTYNINLAEIKNKVYR